MNKTQEALKLALEALKTYHYAMIDAGVLDRQEVLNQGFTAATAVKEALAERPAVSAGPITPAMMQGPTPEQKSQMVAAMSKLAEQPAQKRPQNCGTGYCSCIECVMEQPAQRKPLTDEEIQTIAFEAVKENWDWLRFARAIEAAYGIKENT